MRLPQVLAGLAAAAALIAACLGVVAALAGSTPSAPPYHESLPEDALRLRLREPALVAEGRRLYTQNCTLCHGVQGQGLTGPNLRDDHWLHGNDARQLVESIANGSPAKGMAPWGRVFAPEKLHALAAFVASLKGSEDGSGKAAEGAKQPIGW